MPAARTKASKRAEPAAPVGNQFVWASQPDHSNGSEMSFISDAGSIDVLDDLPPLVDPPTEFIMFPPSGETSTQRKQPHSKKKPENHIPRPPNAFILFRSSFIKAQHVSTEVETNHSTLSKIIGLTWQNLPEDQRKVWHAKAKEALSEHKRKFPKYAFRPVQTKAKGAPSEKRKVREVEPKDIKRCTKIAQLLVEGKKGRELDEAIQEFDKHHVPEIVTRFEAPITARAFRRSSSAPIPDTENSRASQSFFQQVLSSPQKARPASTRPTRCSTPLDTSYAGASSPAAMSDASLYSPSPSKEESSFNFDNFSFDNIAAPVPTYECDPFSLQQFDARNAPSGLSLDTSFLQDWASSPHSESPATPSYMTSPSPTISASPAPSFDSEYGNYTPVLGKGQSEYAHAFTFQSHCGPTQDADLLDSSIGNMTLAGGHNIYTAFDHTIHQPTATLAHVDFDFSAFMTPVPQYAI
ncbi:hypothetical protein CVT26_006333 [Gymnopilus dilepis]|uniref:HMG box domain-containing protein n=1 Tax=Gymnopilus dilepis TaxID=231916 RepID=A0A409Y0K1_9AGAR|nr:hypothetical protein CVT26_006333 [Gymnopilus dilepis]